MRWFWIDRFTEFHSGTKAVAIKNVSLAEQHLEEYLPGYPVMPNSLIVEGLAQTGGLLVGEHNDFQERVVLAKVSKARFLCDAVPGDTLIYTATVDDIRPDGAIVQGTSHRGEQLQAEIELVFAHLPARFQGVDQFFPAEFFSMLRAFCMFDVGKNADGTPLSVPKHLLEAERVADGHSGPLLS